MDLHFVLLSVILAVSLASTERCASSPGSWMDLYLHSQKNASGHWVITVNTQRSIVTENQREFIMNVQQETRICGNNEIKQLNSMTAVYPPLHDSSISGAMEPATPSTTTMITPTATITTTTRPMPCPHNSGYQLFPGYNCYKAFPSDGERKNWSDARERCRKDGGDLMAIETSRERKDVFIPLYESVNFLSSPWMGVYMPQGQDIWLSVRGEAVVSIRWWPGEPEKNTARKCAIANANGKLGNWECASRQAFICEIIV
ncbi:macrophage mannose receptor 1 [Anabrus simplex]|uniref:macrophage mannose receptor 1 n=1 Tax=Anabrus simplex TaxID=316456 RepID=UPI0035A385AD